MFPLTLVKKNNYSKPNYFLCGYVIACFEYMCYNLYIVIKLRLNRVEFKDKVKIAREKLVLSQAEFAKELGVAYASVNRWENGARIPTYALQRKFYEFCSAKGVEFNESENAKHGED